MWQRNYYDHIIRNENEYNRIVEYIINNPIKWENDKLNGGNGYSPNDEYKNEILHDETVQDDRKRVNAE